MAKWLATDDLVDAHEQRWGGFFQDNAAEQSGRRLAGTFMISSVSNVSKSWKRLNTNEKSWHDGHGKKGLRIVVTCPLKTLIFQRKVDIGHAGHGNFIKSLRARNIHSFDYVRGMYVREVCMHDVGMWVYIRHRMYMIVDIWKFVHVWYVSFHAHVGVYTHSCSCEWSWRRNACYI